MARRSLEHEIEEAMEVGRKNKRLWPKVDNWCKHLEIKMTTAGLIAQMSELPVGSLRIECDHASNGGVESMHIEQVASSFIVKNCRGCPYHEMVSSDNIGEEIIEEYESDQEDEEEEKSEVEESRGRLEEKISEEDNVLLDDIKSLDEHDIPEKSIIKCVLQLREENSDKAAEILKEAAHLEPDWFSDDAVKVICSHFSNQSHGSDCISCIRAIEHFDGFVLDSAWECVKNGYNADVACALIGDYWQEESNEITLEKLRYVAAVPSFVRGLAPPGPVGKEATSPSYPGSMHALRVAGEFAPDSLFEIFREYVSQDIPSSRVNAANIIQRLIGDFPKITLRLVPVLLETLELEDARSSRDSADAAVCQAIADLYVRDPDMVQSEIDRAYRRASNEAREAIMGVYRVIVNSAQGRRSTDEKKEAISALSRVISVLLRIIEGLYYDVEVKRKASDTLHQIARSHPSLMRDHLEGVLGALGIVTREHDSIASSEEESFESSLERDTKLQTYGYIARKIVDSIKEIASDNPETVFDLTTDISDELDGSKSYESRYRQRLVSIYDAFVSHPHLVAELIPKLYSALLNFDSVRVRGAAVETLQRILRKRSDVVPRKMIETLVSVHLKDNYVYVHKRAIRALRYCDIESNDLLAEAVDYLYRWYLSHSDDPHFQKTILESLNSITFDHPGLIKSVTGPVALDLAKSDDVHVSGDALQVLERLLPDLDDSFAAGFIRLACEHLRATQRDRYNNPPYRDRFRILMALYEQPTTLIANEVEKIKEAARSKFDDDPHDAIRFVYLLAYHEMYDEARSLLSELVESLDDVRKNERLLRKLEVEGGVLKANQEVADSNSGSALQVLSDLESKFEAIQNEEDRSRSTLDTIPVAEEIAERYS
jgi:hypothetical protein